MKISIINSASDKCAAVCGSRLQHRTGGRTGCTMFADTQLISPTWEKKKDEREMCSDSRGQNKKIKKFCEVPGVKIQFKEKKCKSVCLSLWLDFLTPSHIDKVMRRL